MGLPGVILSRLACEEGFRGWATDSLRRPYRVEGTNEPLVAQTNLSTNSYGDSIPHSSQTNPTETVNEQCPTIPYGNSNVCPPNTKQPPVPVQHPGLEAAGRKNRGSAFLSLESRETTRNGVEACSTYQEAPSRQPLPSSPL